MRIFDLDNIVNIEQYGKLYDLFQNNYTYSRSDIEFIYVVEREMESRIDLICNKLYSNIDNIDFLLSYNKIDNPLNIMENDIIRYIDVFKIDQSKILNNLNEVNKVKVLNNNKSIIDNNRKEYLNRLNSPVYNKVPYKPVTSNNGKITIQ